MTVYLGKIQCENESLVFGKIHYIEINCLYSAPSFSKINITLLTNFCLNQPERS
jgi:hypothetical protein